MKEEIDRLIVKARKLRRKEEFQQAEEESQQALALIKEVLKIVKRLPEEQRVEFCIEWKRYLRIGGKLKKLGDKRKSNWIEKKKSNRLCLLNVAAFYICQRTWQKVDIDEIRISQERAYTKAVALRDFSRVGDFSHNLIFLLELEADEEIDPERKRARLIEAIKKYEDLLLIRRLAGDKRGEAMTLDRQAECSLKLAKVDLNEATKIYTQTEDKEG